jgi:L-ascorbate metabolism protein UlaG (beta-lactamase superfamily)
MAFIRRLSDSCLLVTNDDGTTMFDPGFFTWESGDVDLNTIGDVQRVMITHEHGDHVKPEFVRWLIDRGSDVAVYSNEPVRELLAPHDIEVITSNPPGASSEDVLHEMTPMGTAPPNRSWTIDGLLTHPGDSYQITATAPVLALPVLVLWGSTTASVEFARRLAPQQVVMVHDFYTSAFGRQRLMGMVKQILAPSGIELVPLDWGESYTL